MSCTAGASAESTAIVGVMDSAGVVYSGGVVDVVDVEMIELVSIDSDVDMVVEVMVDVTSSELVCSIVVDVVSVGDFRLVDSVVGVGVGWSSSVGCVSALGSDPSSLPGSGWVPAPSGPRRNGVPALARK